MIFQSLRLIFLIFFVLLLNAAVFACTCIDYGVPACKLFGDADAVFVGKVQRIVPADEDKDAQVSLPGVNSISSRGVGLVSVEFGIEKAFKGVSGKTIKALTYTGTSCDLGVKEGERWVIFANEDGQSGPLGFGACGGSGQIADRDIISKELEEFMDPSGSPIVRGRITLGRFDGIKDAKVSLIGQGVEMNTLTDKDGAYVFKAPKPGKYTVKLTVPFSAGILPTAQTLPVGFNEAEPTEKESKLSYKVLANSGACSYDYFDAFRMDLKATASISGNFIRTDQSFSREFYPKICHLKATESDTLHSCEMAVEPLKPDGSFIFQLLREGRYVIVLGGDHPSGPEPFLRHYYPGVKEFSKASIIQIRQGEERRGLRFRIPSVLPTKAVHGQIVSTDGSMAALQDADGRYFYLSAYYFQNGKEPDLFFQHSYMDEWTKDGKGHEVEMVKSKPDGTFELELFEGFTYIIKAESGQAFNRKTCGLTKIDVNANLQEPVKIVLDRDRPCDAVKFANERPLFPDHKKDPNE